MNRHEKAIITFLRTRPVVSIFWVTKNQRRAETIQSLQDRGVIQRVESDPRDTYPRCVFLVREECK